MCHIFLKPQARANLNDGNVRNGRNVGNVRNFGNIRNAEISGMSVSSLIPFRNHMDLHMLHGCRLGMSVIFLKTTPEYISENRDAPYYVRGV